MIEILWLLSLLLGGFVFIAGVLCGWQIRDRNQPACQKCARRHDPPGMMQLRVHSSDFPDQEA